jgi:hypothetical protein
VAVGSSHVLILLLHLEALNLVTFTLLILILISTDTLFPSLFILLAVLEAILGLIVLLYSISSNELPVFLA